MSTEQDHQDRDGRMPSDTPQVLPPPAHRYERSLTMLRRAERVIPLGSQTFSKSRTQFPLGASPLFMERACGCEVWDVDGNAYVDFICSLGAITLGHGHEEVRKAVCRQVERGVLFSLASPLEHEVAELIVQEVPCAEMVRFGKNGSDATAGAIRLARAWTGRDHVAVCGYHGWQDWYIGSTARHRGVPQATRALTHRFGYNDIDSLHALLQRYPGELAAVIMEPVSFEEPRDGFLHAVRELCDREGIVLIFDEVVTGFRLAPGTAQALYGVTPDLATIGKGLGNGFPISAVVGRADMMRLMEEVFFSFTMGGEAVSLAAAKTVLEVARRENLYGHFLTIGCHLKKGVQTLIRQAGLQEVLSLQGHPSWTLLQFADTQAGSALELKTLYMQECLRRGILTFGVHFLMQAHEMEHVQKLLQVYEEVFDILKHALASGNIAQYLHCKPLEPLFKVRS